MRCLECGTRMRTGHEDFDYGDCGLPVLLLDVTVRRCPRCHEWEVSIPRVEELHASIALAVAGSAGPLSAGEVRFLRKWMGWSGQELARNMGVTPESVSRWENGARPMGPTAERLLRLMVLTRSPGRKPLDALAGAGRRRRRRAILRVRAGRRGWRPEAA